MKPVFLHIWDDVQDIIHDFEIDTATLEGCEILFASYEIEDYEGSAFVLFRKENKLYEVNGSHCSCYGLEDQWEPEETTKEALLYRIENGCTYSGTEYKNELKEFLGELR